MLRGTGIASNNASWCPFRFKSWPGDIVHPEVRFNLQKDVMLTAGTCILPCFTLIAQFATIWWATTLLIINQRPSTTITAKVPNITVSTSPTGRCHVMPPFVISWIISSVKKMSTHQVRSPHWEKSHPDLMDKPVASKFIWKRLGKCIDKSTIGDYKRH